jgi:hypothetical protein
MRPGRTSAAPKRTPAPVVVPRAGGWAARVMCLVAPWWGLCPGDLRSWIVGLPAAVLAAWAGTALTPPLRPRLRLCGCARFASRSSC